MVSAMNVNTNANVTENGPTWKEAAFKEFSFLVLFSFSCFSVTAVGGQDVADIMKCSGRGSGAKVAVGKGRRGRER